MVFNVMVTVHRYIVSVTFIQAFRILVCYIRLDLKETIVQFAWLHHQDT